MARLLEIGGGPKGLAVALYFKTNPDGSWPLEPHVEIRYSKEAWSQGDAWRDLWSAPPNFQYLDEDWTPLFPRLPEPVEPRRRAPRGQGSSQKDFRRGNPYRKAHTDTHWVWRITECRRGKSKRGKPLPGRWCPAQSRRTRYDLIGEDWL